jgi:hypothetical protein
MSIAPASVADHKSAAWLGWVWGGLIAGVMDITAAFVVYGHYGLKPLPLLKGIAAGLLASEHSKAVLPWRCLGSVATSSSNHRCGHPHFLCRIADRVLGTMVQQLKSSPFLG